MKEGSLMKGTRYREEQIVRILREIGEGRSVAEAARQYGVSPGTVYRWRQKYDDMDVSAVRRLRELELENARLKRLVGQQALDNDALKELLRGKS